METSVPHGAGFAANKILCGRAESIEDSSGHIAYTFLEVANALSSNARDEAKSFSTGNAPKSQNVHRKGSGQVDDF